MKNSDVADALKSMSREDCFRLSDAICKAFGVSVPAQPAQPVLVDIFEESFQEEFTVVLTSVGTNKIAVLKTVRELTKLGLKEVKDAIESPPFKIVEAASKDKAEECRDKLTLAGAVVELQ